MKYNVILYFLRIPIRTYVFRTKESPFIGWNTHIKNINATKQRAESCSKALNKKYRNNKIKEILFYVKIKKED